MIRLIDDGVVSCHGTIAAVERRDDPISQSKFAGQVMAGTAPKGFPADIVRVAQRKLFMIDQAAELSDLAMPPNNRLEALKKDRIGQNSIRINDKWRVCFRWTAAGAEDVEVVDYH